MKTLLALILIACNSTPKDSVEEKTPTTTDTAIQAEDSANTTDTSSEEEDSATETMDSLDQILDNWFIDYNAGQSQDYLSQSGTLYTNGDPNDPDLPPHIFVADVAYGPYSRNVLDLWMPESQESTPLAVYIHGGGFIAGDKSDIRNSFYLQGLLDLGFAVASIHYRWAYRDNDAALQATIPNDIGEEHNVNGTRLDFILRDCARSIQFLRHKAIDWNINPDKIAVWGGSAGAGCAMWTASVPDLAQPEHPDPVLRQSSRLQFVGHVNGQVSYNIPRWPELLNLDSEFLFNIVDEDIRLTQMSREEQAQERGLALAHILDYYEHLSLDDPPFYSQNSQDDLDESQIDNSGQIVHHPRGHVALYERCQEVGMNCDIRSQILNTTDQNLIEKMVEALQE